MTTPLTWSDFVRFVDRRQREHPEEFPEMADFPPSQIQYDRAMPQAKELDHAKIQGNYESLANELKSLRAHVIRLEDKVVILETELGRLNKRFRP